MSNIHSSKVIAKRVGFLTACVTEERGPKSLVCEKDACHISCFWSSPCVEKDMIWSIVCWVFIFYHVWSNGFDFFMNVDGCVWSAFLFTRFGWSALLLLIFHVWHLVWRFNFEFCHLFVNRWVNWIQREGVIALILCWSRAACSSSILYYLAVLGMHVLILSGIYQWFYQGKQNQDLRFTILEK